MAKSGLPVESIDPARATEHYGWVGAFFGMELSATSDLTRRELGWEPTHPTLLQDIASGAYFEV